jgi:hypothetical protein
MEPSRGRLVDFYRSKAICTTRLGRSHGTLRCSLYNRDKVTFSVRNDMQKLLLCSISRQTATEHYRSSDRR